MNLSNCALLNELAQVGKHCRSIGEIAFKRSVGVDQVNVWLEENLVEKT